ncbi:MAG: hypothetical protein WBG70_08355 [Spirulinaceae cyanobacterium]
MPNGLLVVLSKTKPLRFSATTASVLEYRLRYTTQAEVAFYRFRVP